MVIAKEGIYEVVWPRGKKMSEPTSLAQRLDTLKGKTVGQLWDYVFRGDEIFRIIQDQLSIQYPGIKFINYDKFGNTHDKNEAKVLAELPAKLKKYGCDAVISAVGC
ncbi:MAG: hypothetical protein JW882_16750 [Deltaproteobacteria bacterium]|nr:hypothetical protein [Deltaproteobacteria bacterium]